MQQYEYKAFTVETDCPLNHDTALLNEYGREGWKLVATAKTTEQIVYYMERPLQSSTPFR